MDDLSSRQMDANAFVSGRLSEVERARDGLPAAVLLDDCLMVDDRSGAVARSAQALAAHILAERASTIECDLERFPPPTVEVLQTTRQRMLDARDALLRERSLLHELSEFAPNRAEPNEWLRAGTRRSGGALSDALNPLERDAAPQGNSRRAASPARWPALAAPQPSAYQTSTARP